MEPQEIEKIEKKFQEQVRRRCQSLECQGYILVRDKVIRDSIDAPDSLGKVLEDLLQKEFGRKEYVVVPNNSDGSSHRIYAKDIVKYK